MLLIPIFIFTAGAVIGSFLNVIIYRLPRGESIIFPGSRCPNCGHPIKWYDNVPIISFILLGGKCRYCKSPISPRYPIVEFITASFFLVHYILWGISWKFFAFNFFVLILLTSTLIDLDFKRIPNILTYGGIAVGLLLSGLTGFIPFEYSLLGALIGGIVLLVVRVLGGLVFKREAIGLGDVKLLSSIGAFLGPIGAVASLFMGSLLGTLMVPVFKREGDTKDGIPFGPFLTLGAMSFLYFSKDIVRLISP